MKIGDEHSEEDWARTVRSKRRADLQAAGKLRGYVSFIGGDEEKSTVKPRMQPNGSARSKEAPSGRPHVSKKDTQ